MWRGLCDCGVAMLIVGFTPTSFFLRDSNKPSVVSTQNVGQKRVMGCDRRIDAAQSVLLIFLYSRNRLGDQTKKAENRNKVRSIYKHYMTIKGRSWPVVGLVDELAW